MGTRRWHGFIKAGASGPGARGPGRGSEAQDGTEPCAPGKGILPGQRLTSASPTHSQSLGSPLCPPWMHLTPYITITAFAPRHNPRPPSLGRRPPLPPLVVAGAPPQAVPHPVSSQLSWQWPGGLGMQKVGRRCYSR